MGSPWGLSGSRVLSSWWLWNRELGGLGRSSELWGTQSLGEPPETEAKGGARVAQLPPQIWLWGGHSGPDQTGPD